jgi:hypothetical protein
MIQDESEAELIPPEEDDVAEITDEVGAEPSQFSLFMQKFASAMVTGGSSGTAVFLYIPNVPQTILSALGPMASVVLVYHPFVPPFVVGGAVGIATFKLGGYFVDALFREKIIQQDQNIPH